LRRIFRYEREDITEWRKLFHNEELPSLCSLPDILRAVKIMVMLATIQSRTFCLLVWWIKTLS
jgi:hypothetical protein